MSISDLGSLGEFIGALAVPAFRAMWLLQREKFPPEFVEFTDESARAAAASAGPAPGWSEALRMTEGA